MQFAELRLVEPIVRAVAAAGYTTPTPIQQQAIPPARDGRDVLGCAQTGTGKTGAFALPVLHRLAERTPRSSGPAPARGRRTGPRGSRGHRGTRGAQTTRHPRALVLCPTRELATQITESFDTYGQHLPLRTATIFGGVKQTAQVRALRRGTDIVVATPGRLLDLIGQGLVNLSQIEILVLDEADRMLDMGFVRDIRRIIGHIPKKRQTLFFSATMPPATRSLADDLLHDPATVEVAPVASTADAIEQSIHFVAKPEKNALLQKLLREESMSRTLVFTRTKHGADRLVRHLGRAGIQSGAIHGNKTQNARTRTLDRFKSGAISVLVATDVASRGIDIDDITHVVNYDLPTEPETYVHRIGRTGRSGRSGIAVSFCTPDDRDALRDIERLIDQRLSTVGEQKDARPRRRKSSARRGPGSDTAASSKGTGRKKSSRRRRRRARQPAA